MTMEALYKRGGVAPGRGQAPRPPQHHPAAPSGVVGPRGAHRIIKPLGLTVIAPNSDTPGLRINWPEDGRVVAFSGCGFDPDAVLTVPESSARLQLQLQLDGGANIISNGEAGDWASLYSLTPASAPWFALDLPVRVNQPWLITLRNLGGQSVVPELLFAFRRGR